MTDFDIGNQPSACKNAWRVTPEQAKWMIANQEEWDRQLKLAKNYVDILSFEFDQCKHLLLREGKVRKNENPDEIMNFMEVKVPSYFSLPFVNVKI